MLAKAPTSDAEAVLILRAEEVALPVPLCLQTIGNSVFGICLMLTDLSERKRFEELERAQAALRKNEEALRQADRRKDEFLATLAHELRNPLAPMRNAVAFLRAKGTSAPELRWAHDVIDRQVALMARLLDDLLDVSRVALDRPDLKRTLVELGSVIDAAVETSLPLIEAARHELTVSLPPQPIYLHADPVRLAQVFANLLNNAAKYTDEGGRIRLVAEQRGHEVVISVSDTGIGIAPELLPHVFEIFSQAKSTSRPSKGGLGIGLSLVKGLVELHGGLVNAHSDGLAEGSTFTVRLPIVDGAEPRKGSHRSVQADSVEARATRRILVVDDQPDSADSLSMLLQALGHDVDTAYDAERAIELAGTMLPDVILLDIGMPRIDGYEACRRIRSGTGGEKMRIVALTGWGQEEDRQKSREAGFDQHLMKPVDMGQLTRLLESAPAGQDADGPDRSDPVRWQTFPGKSDARPGRRSSGAAPTS
jgi:signal transduction histidine kinase/CheY-like chemotaxis protein